MLASASCLLLRQAASPATAHCAAKGLSSCGSSVESAAMLLLRSISSIPTTIDHHQHHQPSLRFHVEPGATLSIDSGPETKVEVTVSPECHDAIEASWTLREGGMKSLSTSSTTSSTSTASLPVEAKQVDGRVSLRVASSSPSADVSLLSVRIPSRYCSLRATTRGGDLFVEAIREASLEASTSPGGAVSLGTVRATVAKVVTGGKSRGGVSARELVADCLSVSTESRGKGSSGNDDVGGDVFVERLVARRGSVRTGGGELRVRSAFYGERLDLDSGGGDISLLGLTPRASESNSDARGASSSSSPSSSSSSSSSSSPSSSSPPLATIRSHGGSLSAGGVEGDADVDSGGGELSLHLLRGARAVRARSGGGSSAAIAVAPELLASGGMIAGDGVVLISSSASSSAGRLKDVSSAADEAEASLEARWNSSNKKEETTPSPSSSPCFAPLTPASAAAASTAGRRGGGDRVRDHGPLPSTVVLVDARPGGEVSVVEETWADAVARRARRAMEGKRNS